jgi:hypothetical protein
LAGNLKESGVYPELEIFSKDNVIIFTGSLQSTESRSMFLKSIDKFKKKSSFVDETTIDRCWMRCCELPALPAVGPMFDCTYFFLLVCQYLYYVLLSAGWRWCTMGGTPPRILSGSSPPTLRWASAGATTGELST